MADSQSPRFTAPTARILVVDDLPTNIRVFKEIISPCGAKILIALSGAKAIEMVKKDPYDLVFMDQMMPEMDGMQTIANIRALTESGFGAAADYFQKLPIVLLTANEATQTKEDLEKLGINGYVTKPIDVTHLFETIEKLLPADKIIRN